MALRVPLLVGDEPLVIAGEPVTAELGETGIQAVVAAVVDETQTRESHSAASPFMTVKEAADYLRTTPQAIYDRLSAGKLARVKDGRRTLIERAEIERLLSR